MSRFADLKIAVHKKIQTAKSNDEWEEFYGVGPKIIRVGLIAGAIVYVSLKGEQGAFSFSVFFHRIGKWGFNPQTSKVIADRDKTIMDSYGFEAYDEMVEAVATIIQANEFI